MAALKDFGDRIRRLRALTALKGMDLDKLAGLSRGLSGQIERGSRPETTMRTVAAIADVFGVSSDYLFRGIGQRPTDDEIVLAVARARAKSRGGRSKAA